MTVYLVLVCWIIYIFHYEILSFMFLYLNLFLVEIFRRRYFKFGSRREQLFWNRRWINPFACIIIINHVILVQYLIHFLRFFIHLFIFLNPWYLLFDKYKLYLLLNFFLYLMIARFLKLSSSALLIYLNWSTYSDDKFVFGNSNCWFYWIASGESISPMTPFMNEV